MSVERPYFLEAYNAVEVPRTIRTVDEMGDNSVDDVVVRETIETFFAQTVEAFGLGYLAMQRCFFIDSRMISQGTTGAASDDFIETLEIQDRQIIASAIRIRDQWNYQVTHFAKYPLTATTLEVIREFGVVDEIIKGPNQ